MTVKKSLENAKKSFYASARLNSEQKYQALIRFAELIWENKDFLLKENDKDLKKQKGKLSTSLYDRLKLDESKIKILAQGTRDLAAQPDPVGKILTKMKLDEGLVLEKISVPLGVVGIIFESRPDVIPQVLALILKSGNTAILKGGSEALHSNKAFMKIVGQLNKELLFLPKYWAQLFVDRKAVHEMLKYPEYVSLIIPRGGNKLVRTIIENTKIPVMGHADGICHVYVHKMADLNVAKTVILDSKTQYPSACNAMETLLVDESIAESFIPEIVSTLRSKDVVILGDKLTKKWVKDVSLAKTWVKEYSDLTCAVRVVKNIDEAIEHINTFGSHHTDTIISQDPVAQNKFFQEVDSASLLVNASTRFADGFRFGMGAEVGISTNKTHARGPVGIDGLVLYKYIVRGQGHIVADYVGGNAKSFKHEKLL